MKRIALFLSILLLLVFVLSPNLYAEAPGDANGDGKLDALDITKVERIVAGLDTETPGADANQDGSYNALDITKVERIIAGLDCITHESPTQEELEQARHLYSADITRMVLDGSITPPAGFDCCFISLRGQERLDALRAGSEMPTGPDNDIAAVCLLRLSASPIALLGVDQVTVEFVNSTYQVASGSTSGFFNTGQDADIMLSGIDFNNTGGSLLFNHQAGIATDGTHLLLADTYNNRVLVWNSLPAGNVEPDLVLGQKDFITNNPGTGRDEMNWPVSVATDGQRVVVADTENHRILIWNSFPTQNGTAADLVIQGTSEGIEVSKTQFHWPWGLWTDGQKMAISSTRGSAVLIWNQFPTQENQPADILLTAGGDFGTPRQVTSDGDSLIVGDHNAQVDGRPGTGSFVWKTFPTVDEQPYDFYMNDPLTGSGPWLHGTFTSNGRLILLGRTIHIWDSFPQDLNDSPDLSISIDAYDFQAGDHSGVAVAGNKLFISTGNGNSILVYNSIPTQADQVPDFAIGSPDIYTNTLETNFIISNPIPVSNGTSLFVASDIDRKLYVWEQLPDESGSKPDVVYSLWGGPIDSALWGNTLALVSKTNAVYIWEDPPLGGQGPDVVLYRTIGSVELNQLQSVAMDDRYFYLGDYGANKVYVWEGIPSPVSEPAFILDVDGPWRLSSDGNYLTVAQLFKQTFLAYPLAGLSAETTPISIGGPGVFNGVQSAVAAQGHFFVADGGNHRVLAWNNIGDVLSGQEADAILGTDNKRPEIGKNKLFCPATVSFDGSYLWVGETKFSERLLRFSPSP
ncbi:dockerin type I domain-containing protein [Chloroflexota bacterium]